jgi:hypothetical protein
MVNKVVNFFGKLIEKADPDITLKLERVVYSKKHHQEICILQLVGKNIWPKMTPAEILSDPKASKGLSAEDLIQITRLDETIKHRHNTRRILEIDKNGTILLEGYTGEVKRYSEKYVSTHREMLQGLSSLDAHDLGYRVGFRDGLTINSLKKAKTLVKEKILQLLPVLKLRSK